MFKNCFLLLEALTFAVCVFLYAQVLTLGCGKIMWKKVVSKDFRSVHFNKENAAVDSKWRMRPLVMTANN